VRSTVSVIRNNLIQIFLVVSAFIWMLAVIKVFLLEGNHRISYDPVNISSKAADILSKNEDKIPVEVLKNKFVSRLEASKPALTEKAAKIIVPTSSEWAFIRNSLDYKIAGNRQDVDIEVGTIAKQQVDVPLSNSEDIKLKKAYELTWPPVQADGSITVTDGVEVMPLIGLKVPRFWEAPEGFDVNKVGSKVNGEDTIFLMIASYRDFQCRETITSAFKKSDHPERLFVGAVDQTVPGDTGCLDLEIPCSVDSTQALCVYRDQIAIFHMDAMYATGPVTGQLTFHYHHWFIVCL
jgi:hypothetical protein